MAERGVAGGNSSCLGLWYQQRLLGPDCFVEASCGSVRLVRPAGLVGPVCRSGSAATWSLLLASAFFARVCGGRASVWLWALPAAPYGVWHPSSIQAHGARMDGGASAYGFRHTSNQFSCSMADRVGGLSVVSPTGEPREPCSRHGVVKGGGACFRINTWRVFRGRALIKAVLRGRQ